MLISCENYTIEKYQEQNVKLTHEINILYNQNKSILYKLDLRFNSMLSKYDRMFANNQNTIEYYKGLIKLKTMYLNMLNKLATKAMINNYIYEDINNN